MATACFRRLVRRKKISSDEIEDTNLSRCLTTLDLTALGVGSTLGAGAYVIAGTVARTDAGPAVILSFLIAAIASVLAGLCYAEFGARVPKAGSAYIYTYVTVGELLAFIIGWNLILEYVIGTASVARTFSGYFDDLVGDKLIPFFSANLPMNVNTLAPYFDPMAFGITMVVTIILAVGVKESAMFTNCFTLLNLAVLSYVIVCGAFKDESQNWSLSSDKIPNATYYGCAHVPNQALQDNPHCCGRKDGCGSGGFAPYGFPGIISGAATCFFAFVGFDAIATTGEEVKNPQRAIPIAIIASLGIIFIFYSGISLTITMMVPYYTLTNEAPFAKIYRDIGWTVSKYVVSVGAICALCTSLLGAMFPMPRVVLAMGRDGLIFKFFERVSARFKTPIIATLFTGTLAGLMAALFDVKSLVDMMSIGTLLAYTLVSACVLLLRYDIDIDASSSPGYETSSDDSSISNKLKLFIRPNQPYPTSTSARTVKWLTCFYSISLIVIGVILTYGEVALIEHQDPTTIFFLAFSVLCSIVCLALITFQPRSRTKLPFTVPFVPWFPGASMFFNIYLMLNLDYLTWIRFLVWMIIGFSIYFFYGIWHSSEEKRTSPSPLVVGDESEDEKDNEEYQNQVQNVLKSDQMNAPDEQDDSNPMQSE